MPKRVKYAEEVTFVQKKGQICIMQVKPLLCPKFFLHIFYVPSHEGFMCVVCHLEHPDVTTTGSEAFTLLLSIGREDNIWVRDAPPKRPLRQGDVAHVVVDASWLWHSRQLHVNLDGKWWPEHHHCPIILAEPEPFWEDGVELNLAEREREEREEHKCIGSLQMFLFVGIAM